MLKNKLDEAHDLIQILQGLKLDSEESDEAIDQWTQQRNSQLQPYETALEKLGERLKYDEDKRKEIALKDKLNEETIIRDWKRQEEQEAENNKRIREEKFASQLEEKKFEIAEKKRVKPKLPDLQISHFQGTHLDYVRFCRGFFNSN